MQTTTKRTPRSKKAAQDVWDISTAHRYFEQSSGQSASRRTSERRLHELKLLPAELTSHNLLDEAGNPLNPLVRDWAIQKARSRRQLVVFAQLHSSANRTLWLHLNDARGGRTWCSLQNESEKEAARALARLQKHLRKTLLVLPHAKLAGLLRNPPKLKDIEFAPEAYAPHLELPDSTKQRRSSLTRHLKRLEDESIHIIREAVAEAERPVMLYSIGKDSAVMLRLAQKAFYPASPPFPLLHVDTRWKFREMYLLRDYMAKKSGMELLVHVNPEAIRKNINPFDHGSALHTDITKTEGLKQALDEYRFDVIFGGARRDEEKSRAKERIFSFRSPTHRWDPKNQRPELWNLYNARKGPGESIRVFPLSNWTEVDVWQYIDAEKIPIVPLYFAKRRPVVQRDGMLIMVDDDRFRLLPDEEIEMRMVRFRTLGCYPLTGAIESSAQSVPEIIRELNQSRHSERQGRAIDKDSSGSMEKKKQEGYF